jgi:hypothetical protein
MSWRQAQAGRACSIFHIGSPRKNFSRPVKFDSRQKQYSSGRAGSR